MHRASFPQGCGVSERDLAAPTTPAAQRSRFSFRRGRKSPVRRLMEGTDSCMVSNGKGLLIRAAGCETQWREVRWPGPLRLVGFRSVGFCAVNRTRDSASRKPGRRLLSVHLDRLGRGRLNWEDGAGSIRATDCLRRSGVGLAALARNGWHRRSRAERGLTSGTTVSLG